MRVVKNCVENSKIRIYEKSSDDDPHYLIFDEYNSDIHQPYREMLLKEKHHIVSTIFIEFLITLTCTTWFEIGHTFFSIILHEVYIN